MLAMLVIRRKIYANWSHNFCHLSNEAKCLSFFILFVHFWFVLLMLFFLFLFCFILFISDEVEQTTNFVKCSATIGVIYFMLIIANATNIWQTMFYLHSINHCRIWSCILSFKSGPSISRIRSLMVIRACWYSCSYKFWVARLFSIVCSAITSGVFFGLAGGGGGFWNNKESLNYLRIYSLVGWVDFFFFFFFFVSWRGKIQFFTIKNLYCITWENWK